MKTYIYWLIGFLIMILIVAIIFPFPTIFILSNLFEKSYDKQDLIDNFKKNEKNIYDLKKFVRNELKDSCWINIELKNNQIPIFWVKTKDWSIQKSGLTFESSTTDTLLSKIGWSKTTLLNLRTKLKAANCISIRSGEPSEIGFNRSGMGKFYYLIFDNPLSGQWLDYYDEGCTRELLTKNVVLRYYGGTLGEGCGKGFKKLE